MPVVTILDPIQFYSQINASGITVLSICPEDVGSSRNTVLFMEKLARKYPIILFSISDVSYFTNLCYDRGVTTLPHYFIYRDGQLSDEISTCSECLLESVLLRHIEEVDCSFKSWCQTLVKK